MVHFIFVQSTVDFFSVLLKESHKYMIILYYIIKRIVSDGSPNKCLTVLHFNRSY